MPPRLLAVFAHPDDESIASGGLLALAADAGAEVAVLCLTRGEAAEGAAGTPESRQRLAEIRTGELRAAARVLGITQLLVRDHPDGMLPWIDPAGLDADIQAALEEFRPDVVVTFGPDGLYWHPDHIAICERTTAIVERCGGAAPALYYVTIPPDQMSTASASGVLRGRAAWIVAGLDVPDAWGAYAAPPTLVVDTSRVAGRKATAIACHETQIAGGALDGLTETDAIRLLSVEHYGRTPGGPSTPAFIEAFGHAAAPVRVSPE